MLGPSMNSSKFLESPCWLDFWLILLPKRLMTHNAPIVHPVHLLQALLNCSATCLKPTGPKCLKCKLHELSCLSNYTAPVLNGQTKTAANHGDVEICPAWDGSWPLVLCYWWARPENRPIKEHLGLLLLVVRMLLVAMPGFLVATCS